MTIFEIVGKDKEELEEISKNKELYYLSYPIKKRSGKSRWLDAPQEELKDFQEAFLHKFLYKFKPHPAAVGFVTKKHVADGAKKHLDNNVLLTIDVLNFFGSIHEQKVIKLISFLFSTYVNRDHSFVFDQKDVPLIASLLTFKGSLPQGAPSSPALSNLYCLRLDKNLTNFAKKNGLTYTRYADDSAFSHKNKTEDIGRFIPDIEKFFNAESMGLNKKKTKVRRPHKRMVVTGVVINDKLGIPKWKSKNFRAKLHNLIRDKKPITQEEYQKMRGYAEWIRTLNPLKGRKFIEQLGKVTLLS